MRRPLVPLAALIMVLAGGGALAAPDKPAPAKQAPSQATTKTTPNKTTAVKPTDAKSKAGKDLPERAKSELKDAGVPQVKETVLTPEQVKAQQAEWKKLEDQEREARKARREQFKTLIATYAKEGVTFKRGEKPNTYRVIAPAMAKTTDPTQRKAAAKALVGRIRSQMEPILKKKLTFEVYTDQKATQKVAY